MSRSKKRDAFALLVGTFPNAFSVDPRFRKPLKVGIDADLATMLDGAIQRRELGFALAAYCGSVGYLRNCKVGAERIDLTGLPVGIVTAAEAAHASAKLAAKTKKAATAVTPQPPPAEAPQRLSIADLKRAVQMRKAAAP